MRSTTSITLDEDLLQKIDRLAGSKISRSAFIESVLRNYLRERTRQQRHAQDLQRINAAAERLNLEVTKVLGYQTPEE